LQYFKTAAELARSAGEILRHYAAREKHVSFKGRANLVTIADKESEALIIRGIQDRFPDHSILAEESGAIASAEDGGATRSTVRWIIDPLDGTTNFAHGYPFYCVSIGVEVDHEVVCGVVYDPVRDELFSAEKNGGAYCNDEPIQVSNIERLSTALLITGFPYNFREKIDTVINQFRACLVEAQAVRRGGSAALDLCYLAAGRLDGFWELDLHPWDTAAGKIVVEEAGGRITNFSGEPFAIFMREILASNSRIHDQMIRVLAAVNAGDSAS
jgi:myo-inositol-1(or 4)-monophosphatase